jgi:Na+:H+ antiporter, NhaA family
MELEVLSKLTMPVGERDHIKHSSLNAPVVLVEYGDYECPHCQEVYPILHELKARMGNRIAYVYRHFPISRQHPNAQMAAEAAEAAAAQGKFWEMHHRLFTHQNELGYDDLLRHASAIGLDVDLFRRELEEHTYAGRVREDFISGVRSGVNGTPTFYINETRYDGAWDFESLLEAIEKPLGVQISLLAQEFTRLAASGGIVLLLGTIIAMLWANSAWAATYPQFWQTELGFNLGGLHLSKGLLEWVNDGLMVLFFFVVALEIKREIRAGELASPRRAALPIMAALGGIIVPAIIYTLINLRDPQAMRGWGIPIATDTAFTLAILTMLGNRAPLSLKVFFTALAIADDIGGILVIVMFYSAGIAWLALGIAALFLIGLAALNWARIYNPLPYAILGIGLWLAFLQSGVHPTLAGVLLALFIPTRRPPNTRPLLAQVKTVVEQFEMASEEEYIHEPAIVQTMETIIERMQAPAQRLERSLAPWSTYLILPIFALANAGVQIDVEATQRLFSPIGLGVILGLVIGKPIGISLLSWIALRTGIAEMPGDLRFRQLLSASLLAGMGFTLSLFTARAAFGDSAMLGTVKLDILLASILAGILGTGALRLFSRSRSTTTQLEPVPAAD